MIRQPLSVEMASPPERAAAPEAPTSPAAASAAPSHKDRFSGYQECDAKLPISFSVLLREGEKPLSLLDAIKYAYGDKLTPQRVQQTQLLIMTADDMFENLKEENRFGMSKEEAAAMYLYTGEPCVSFVFRTLLLAPCPFHSGSVPKVPSCASMVLKSLSSLVVCWL